MGGNDDYELMTPRCFAYDQYQKVEGGLIKYLLIYCLLKIETTSR